MQVVSMSMSNPTSTSFEISQTMHLGTSSIFHPTLDSFNASLALDTGSGNLVPFAYVQVPEIQAQQSLNVTITQVVQIANMEAFVHFAEAIVASETYKIALQGQSLVHEPGFPAAHVVFDQSVTLKGRSSLRHGQRPRVDVARAGLNQLKGFSLVNSSLVLPPAPDGSNMVGTVMIPNPSPVSVELV